MDSLLFMAESLCAADRDISLHLTVPDAPDYFRDWARRRPQVVLSTERPEGVTGWDAKPWVMLQALKRAHSQVVWLDDDIIVNRPVSAMLREFPDDDLLFAQEWTSTIIPVSHLWGMPSARPVGLFNNCFIRATQAHRPLLECWLQMTQDPRYREAQALPYEKRPVQAQHDGWLLVALLESEEFSHVSYKCIRRGRHIAQCAGSSGYKPLDRVLDLFRGLPPLIHGLGRKPWEVPSEPGRSQRFLLNVAMDVSPYVLTARKVAKTVGRSPRWLEPRTRTGATFRALTGNHPGMAGLLLSCFHALHMSIGRMMRHPK